MFLSAIISTDPCVFKEILNISRVPVESCYLAAHRMAGALNKDKLGVSSVLLRLFIKCPCIIWLYESIARAMYEKNRSLMTLKTSQRISLLDINFIDDLPSKPYERHQRLHMNVLITIPDLFISTDKTAVRDDKIYLRIEP